MAKLQYIHKITEVEGSVHLVSVVIFWKGDKEEWGEIKTHGLSDQGDSDDQQITVARS